MTWANPDLDRRLATIEQEVLGPLTADEAERLRRLLRKAAERLDTADPAESLHEIARELQAPRRTRSTG